MNKLVALPVSGDAFLLRREDQNILVDGGHNSQALIAALSAPSVAVNELHIVVCTHADKDHAGGLTELLNKSKVRVGEFWLPGAWCDALRDLLCDPRVVVDALVYEFDKFVPEESRELTGDDDEFESRAHGRFAEERRQLERRGGIRADQEGPDEGAGLAWLKEQAASLQLNDANDAGSAKEFARGRRLVRYRASKRHLDQRWVAFSVGLIDTAERIRKIAVQAIRHDVRVRWFDYGEFAKTLRASGGETDLLVPLNAVELLVPPSPHTSMQYMARLTPVNEECLVFLSPGSGGWPDPLGVVFTGDSPLGYGSGYTRGFLDCSKHPRQWVVATAPHHGSESNALAYTHLQEVAHVALWLRSGGSTKHPGAKFRGLSPEERACTHCPHLNLKREAVEVQLSGHFPWVPFRVRSHDCRC